MGEEKEKILERPDDDHTCDSELAYNEEGVDLTLVRQFLAMTPMQRLEEAENLARFIHKAHAANGRA